MRTEKNIFAEIKSSNNFPKLPQVLVRLIKACNDEQSDTQELTDIISMDPGLSSKLLQIVGSIYVSIPGGVNTVKGRRGISRFGHYKKYRDFLFSHAFFQPGESIA